MEPLHRPRNIQWHQETTGLTIGDLDDDGTPDIAVINIIANSLQLLTSRLPSNRALDNRGVR
ncbi:MAG: hypothetical protein ABI882_11835 [Acidobacteriota bacterium]